jgi:hypothetical protein
LARSYKEEKKELIIRRALSAPSLAKAPGGFPVVYHTRDKRKQRGGRRWVYGHYDSLSNFSGGKDGRTRVSIESMEDGADTYSTQSVHRPGVL